MASGSSFLCIHSFYCVCLCVCVCVCVCVRACVCPRNRKSNIYHPYSSLLVYSGIFLSFFLLFHLSPGISLTRVQNHLWLPVGLKRLPRNPLSYFCWMCTLNRREAFTSQSGTTFFSRKMYPLPSSHHSWANVTLVIQPIYFPRGVGGGGGRSLLFRDLSGSASTCCFHLSPKRRPFVHLPLFTVQTLRPQRMRPQSLRWNARKAPGGPRTKPDGEELQVWLLTGASPGPRTNTQIPPGVTQCPSSSLDDRAHSFTWMSNFAKM